MNLIGNVLALREFTQLIVDLVQSEEERGPTSRCEDCLPSGLVQDAHIVVALPQLQDSVVGDVEGLHVVSFAVESANDVAFIQATGPVTCTGPWAQRC